MENPQIYTVVVQGRPEGPYSLTQLQHMSVLPGTFLRKPGMDDYKEAHEFPELRALFGFRAQLPPPQYFASFDQRLLAAAIDYFILFLVYITLLLLLFCFLEEQSARISAALYGLLLLPPGKLLYSTIAECSISGGTAGKRLMNIRITGLSGGRISFSRSLLRNTAKILSVIPCFAGYLYIFLNPRQQSLHDLAAKALVIKERLI